MFGAGGPLISGDRTFSIPMKRSTRFLFAAAVSDTPCTAVKVSTVQKVVRLMEGMLVKGKRNKLQEQVQFGAHTQFCEDAFVVKTRAIEETNEQVNVPRTYVKRYMFVVAQLTKEIASHEGGISVSMGDGKAATRMHGMEIMTQRTTTEASP